MTHPLQEPKWRLPEPSTAVRITREETVRRIADNFARSGRPWTELSHEDLLGGDDVLQLDERIFGRFSDETGRRYEAGCEIAAVERPQRYVLQTEAPDYVDAAELPPGAVGDGDNVFTAADVTGEIVLVREVSEVERLIDEGVPDGAIGVIDDAGGTMSAPILGDFEGVLCLAGSVRSHLAIIAREFEVPTLMGVRLSRPLVNGERVTVRFSAAEQDAVGLFNEDLRARAGVYPEAAA